jgi:C4-dicarboxylate-specific signal transduction histidine kinase
MYSMEKLKISVLYVEDEMILRIIYVRILERLVEKLYVAENGQEGLKVYKDKRPDLVITDIMMPVMNGLEMINRIKSLNKSVKVVILSAYGETDYFIEAIKSGVNCFLLKPVEIDRFRYHITDLADTILLERKVREEEVARRMAEDNLRRLNEELEQRILERTKDLQHEVTIRTRAQKKLSRLNLTLEKRVREELKKLEHQQQLLIQKSKLESLGELAAGIAHEINQPLGGISMGLDNILFKIKNGKSSEEYIQDKIASLFKDIERIRQIINHVRVFSRDQEKDIPERMDVNEVVKHALSMVLTQYQNHGVDVRLNLSEEQPLAMGNRFRLEQVILNMLSNSKYAVEERQRKTGNRKYRKEISVSTTLMNAGRISIEVADNGTGIPKRHIGNIFDPYFTTKDVENGTGLGLSISYGIIKEMKGEILVDSKAGRYTVMRIILPANK